LSFLRHRKIYQSDGLKRELNYSFSSPQTIVPMSLQPAIPSWVALQQSPRPLRRFSTASRLTLLLYSLQQPTATVPIFQCLNSGVHSNHLKEKRKKGDRKKGDRRDDHLRSTTPLHVADGKLLREVNIPSVPPIPACVCPPIPACWWWSAASGGFNQQSTPWLGKRQCCNSVHAKTKQPEAASFRLAKGDYLLAISTVLPVFAATWAASSCFCCLGATKDSPWLPWLPRISVRTYWLP
jgi:hypothetical protein